MQHRTLNTRLNCPSCGKLKPHLFAETEQVTDDEDGTLAIAVYYRCMGCANARKWGFEQLPRLRPRLLKTGGKPQKPPISCAEVGRRG